MPVDGSPRVSDGGNCRNLLTMENSSFGIPDMDICRAKEYGLRGYADCLVEKPHIYQYALSFAHGFFYSHPSRKEIIQKTSYACQNDQDMKNGVGR